MPTDTIQDVRTFADLQARLHKLKRAGQGSSAEANEIRERFDLLASRIPRPWMNVLALISADLFMADPTLRDERLVAPPEFTRDLVQNYGASDFSRWLETRHRLAEHLPVPPKWQVLYAVARGWERLGFISSAYDLFRAARTMAQDNLELAVTVARIAWLNGDRDAAIVEARRILARPAIPENYKTFLLMILVAGLPVEDEEASRYADTLGQLVLWPVPAQLAQQDLDIWSSAVMTLGNFLDRIGRSDEAQRCYRTVLDFLPESPIGHIGLGMSMLRSDPDSARDHLRRSIAHGASVVWPYLVLAREELIASHYAEADHFCRQALSHARESNIQGRLFEWLALSAIGLGETDETIESYFALASQYVPGDETILANWSRFHSASRESRYRDFLASISSTLREESGIVQRMYDEYRPIAV